MRAMTNTNDKRQRQGRRSSGLPSAMARTIKAPALSRAAGQGGTIRSLAMYEKIDGPEGWKTLLRCTYCGTIGAVVCGVGLKAEKHCRARKPTDWGHVRINGKVTNRYACGICRSGH